MEYCNKMRDGSKLNERKDEQERKKENYTGKKKK